MLLTLNFKQSHSSIPALLLGDVQPSLCKNYLEKSEHLAFYDLEENIQAILKALSPTRQRLYHCTRQSKVPSVSN